ncbi:unnamed protein product [Adineta ricciae]|uniref:PiggyBac transposable element-derived protein domain-containing protein n=1 Tax=Adineta ricciae TaxID=249248 RepID=A0A816EPI8_ADIRI|nr:unnamed protein product [Adineta ricciae]
MSCEEIDTDNSENSRSDVSSLDAGFMKIQVESSNSEEEFSDNELDSQLWNEIDSESDGEIQEDYGLVDEVNPTSQDNTTYPIDCYRHFITDEIMSLMAHETNRYAKQHLQAQELTHRSKTLQWKPITHEEMFKFLGIIIEMSSIITIDETMVSWKGRLLFKQYIPDKSYKYGVKIYKVASMTGYTWNFMVYTGKQSSIAADNFFTTISLAQYLLRNDTYLIGIFRSNRAGSLREVAEKKLKHGEVYGLQNKDGMTLIKWKDKRDVLMISTKPSYSATVIDTKKTNKLNERIMKPQFVMDYNQGKQGIDLSDQLSSYYTCLRRSIKWY